MIHLAIGILWLVIGVIILGGVIWIALTVIKKFIHSEITSQIEYAVWAIFAILVLIYLLYALEGGSLPDPHILR